MNLSSLNEIVTIKTDMFSTYIYVVYQLITYHIPNFPAYRRSSQITHESHRAFAI